MVTNLHNFSTSPSSTAGKGLDVKDWLTRIEVCDLIGVSERTLKNWEKQGLLHPRKGCVGGRGDPVVYDPHEVAKLPMSMRRRAAASDSPDELAARAFDMFAQGAAKWRVVTKLRKRPEEIERLYEEWLSMGGSDVVMNDNVRAELARFVGPFESLAELVERVREKLGETFEATVPDHATDAEIEDAIKRTLDDASDPAK